MMFISTLRVNQDYKLQSNFEEQRHLITIFYSNIICVAYFDVYISSYSNIVKIFIQNVLENILQKVS